MAIMKDVHPATTGRAKRRPNDQNTSRRIHDAAAGHVPPKSLSQSVRRLSWCVSIVAEVVLTFCWGEVIEDDANSAPEIIDSALGGLS